MMPPHIFVNPLRLTEHIIISLWSTDVIDEFLEIGHLFKKISVLLLISAN